MKTVPCQRECGSCTACCWTLVILELKKPQRQSCRHCSGTSCSIYERRPDSCRIFKCQWLNGIGEERFRPDRIGIIVDAFEIGPLKKVVFLWEVTADALAKVETWELSRFFLRLGYHLCHVSADGERCVIYLNPTVPPPNKKIRAKIRTFDGYTFASIPLPELEKLAL